MRVRSSPQAPENKQTERGRDLIKEIRRLRRTTKGVTKRRSFREIAEILNDQGRTTKQSRAFAANSVAMIAARAR